MTHTIRTVLSGLFILLFAAAGWSAPAQQNESGMARIWMLNVGRDAIEVKVKRSLAGDGREEALLLPAGELTEARRSAGEEIQIPQQRDLLIVTAPSQFDPAAALRVDTSPLGSGRAAPRRMRSPEGSARSMDRDPAAIRLSRGEVFSSAVTATGLEPRTVRLRLHAPQSWAEVRLKAADGTVLGYVTLGAARAMDVTLDLDPFLKASRYLGIVHREILAHGGEVSAFGKPALEEERGPIAQVTAAVTQGTGEFNYTRNWEFTPPLEYYVRGGPANSCGEANVKRNGTWYFTSCWLFTDGSGNADKGPWYWANQPDDEEGEAFIRWPNGNATTTDWHYWDKRCPSISIRNNPFTHPPTAWSGPASDPPFGACFGAWTSVYATFQNLSTGRYWAEGASDYTLLAPDQVFDTSLGLSGCNDDWQTPFPPGNAHVSGHQYRWTVCLIESPDSRCEPCASYDFTY